VNSSACYIIAEIGVNHNGSVDEAKKLIDEAKSIGADAVRFQLFDPALLATPDVPMAEYQAENTGQTGSQLEMLSTLTLSKDEHKALFEHCQETKIDYLCSPFDIDSALFLAEDLRLKEIKIGSGELTNAPMLYQLALRDSHFILSTGMSHVAELRNILGIISLGYLNLNPKDFTPEQLSDFTTSNRAFAELWGRVRLLQCTSEYPCKPENINLNAMDKLAEEFRLPVGLSDHSIGNTAAIAAVAKGASIIEKHFTLDKTQQGPDHKASMDVAEFKSFVEAIRDTEKVLGKAEKEPTESETKILNHVRKHIVAATDIRSGDTLDETNIVCKRATSGASPMLYWYLLGTPAKSDYKANEGITQ